MLPRVEIIIQREPGEWKWTVILDGCETGTGAVPVHGDTWAHDFNAALKRAGGYALVLVAEHGRIKEVTT